MLLKNIESIPSFIAGDETILKEILHPTNDGINIPYSIASAKVEIGKKSLPHQLKGSEVYIITQGKGEVHINDEVATISKNQFVYIPPNMTQWIENTGEEVLEFLCIVHPFWQPEEEVIL
ncbi:MAG: mannose-6-phosphate isomerase-like protein (cupin superfamily) [Cognaticolwellia sp.]|jgi:mannose-6-phosphate isomerase-like protein (cupin superfamily)|tara:strand:+ start:551 stop:910 length:360 start_codon:yes stop_codon:yes gene_type:complete